MTPWLRFAALGLACALAARPAHADETASAKELDTLYETVERLEHRINELESANASSSARGSAGDWSERVRLSGSAELDYLQGQGADYGLYDEGSTQIYDARVFIDANLGSDARIGESTVYRDAGFTFEWNLVRLGSVRNEVGDLYVDLRGVGGRDWLNLEAGRFQIPFGENYLRFGRGRKADPFVALSAAPPWFWDEGVKLWGKSSNGRFGYIASVTDGEGGINIENNSSKQVTLKLSWDPSEWLHLSASALRTGKLGSDDEPAVASVWLGEAYPKSFGLSSSAVNYDHGVALADGPNELSNITVIGADAVVNLPAARIWLSAGSAAIDSTGPGVYNRDLLYWLAEVVFQLRTITSALDPMYLAVRANGLGTYDKDEGYLLDFRYRDVGYNMRALDAYAVALGLPLGNHIVLKAQYAIQNMDLVRGITDQDIRDAANDADFFGMEIGVHF
ncbi:MAG: hypothetical protein WEF50_20985 [Myxococcota bacterium]